MKNALMAFAFMMSLVPATRAAEPRYDHKLEKAAARIVAARIGDIRGGFSFGQKPQFVVAQDGPPATAAGDAVSADPSNDRLVPAVESGAGSFLN